MTREHKLALIVGFSLFLVLGVLISDHFSKARQVELAENIQPSSARQMGASVAPGVRVPTEAGVSGSSAAGPTVTPGNIAMGRRDLVPLPGMPGGSGPQVQQIVLGNQRQPTTALADVHGDGSTFAPHVDLDNGSHPQSDSPRGAAQPQIPVQKYEVQEQDTLYRIAVKSYGDGKLWEKLRDYNKDKVGAGNSLREGVTLLIPPKDVLLGKPYTPPASSDMVRLGGPSDAKSSGKPDAPKADPAKPAAGDAREYTVKSGDTLAAIGRKMLNSDKRTSEIIELNKELLSDPDALKVGMKLRIPAK